MSKFKILAFIFLGVLTAAYCGDPVAIKKDVGEKISTVVPDTGSRLKRAIELFKKAKNVFWVLGNDKYTEWNDEQIKKVILYFFDKKNVQKDLVYCFKNILKNLLDVSVSIVKKSKNKLYDYNIEKKNVIDALEIIVNKQDSIDKGAIKIKFSNEDKKIIKQAILSLDNIENKFSSMANIVNAQRKLKGKN